MSYAMIKMNQPFKNQKVEVKDYYLEKNKLWSVNDGDMLLHYAKGSDSFLREIGLLKAGEKASYLHYTDEEMLEIFKHYYQKGELLSVNFRDEYDDIDVNEFQGRIRFKTEKTDLETRDMVEYYRYVTEEITGKPWNFTIVKGDKDVKLYQNSVVFVSGIRDDDEEMAFSIYKEVFALLNKPLKMEEISIEEKEKVAHPLKNAHHLLSALFEVAGDGAVENLNLDEEEYERIKEHLLEYTKEIESKMVYK